MEQRGNYQNNYVANIGIIPYAFIVSKAKFYEQ